jgi:hypothetical protein
LYSQKNRRRGIVVFKNNIETGEGLLSLEECEYGFREVLGLSPAICKAKHVLQRAFAMAKNMDAEVAICSFITSFRCVQN